jgi:DNA adenine methylase
MAGSSQFSSTVGPWGEQFERATRSKPFLRWAGGKARFLALYGKWIPEFHGQYVEPFLGGGATFFHLCRTQSRPFVARLGDVNLHLIRTMQAVRNKPLEVIGRLEEMQAAYSTSQDKAAYYYALREGFNDALPRTNAAAFIMLNRTCWNGLWRINQQKAFNVPYGQPKSDLVIPTQEEMLAASAALRRAMLRSCSWQGTLSLAEPGDFVFLDPPYFSDLVSDRNRSTKYTLQGFSARHHTELAKAAASLRDRNISFMLTNSAEPEMISLYRDFGLQVAITQIPRYINSDTNARASISEILVSHIAS